MSNTHKSELQLKYITKIVRDKVHKPPLLLERRKPEHLHTNVAHSS